MIGQSTQSNYQPVITPADLFTKYPSLQDQNGSSKTNFSSLGTSNAFLLRANTFGMIYFHCLTIALYIAIICYSEYVYTTNSTYVNYLTTYVLINIFANYYLCRQYPAVYNPVEKTELPVEIWTFCSYCQQRQPPRCHHCPLCHKCITKRDHHCFFTGTCVGSKNQGYFTAYCFHVAVGLYIGFGVLSEYLSNTYYELFSLDFYHYFPPITLIQVLLFQVDFLTFVLVFLMFGSFVTGIFTVFLFLWQCVLIACNFTTHEAQNAWTKGGVHWSKIKLWYNIRAVFGPIPFLPFLIPLPIFSTKTRYHASNSDKPFLWWKTIFY